MRPYRGPDIEADLGPVIGKYNAPLKPTELRTYRGLSLARLTVMIVLSCGAFALLFCAVLYYLLETYPYVGP